MHLENHELKTGVTGGMPQIRAKLRWKEKTKPQGKKWRADNLNKDENSEEGVLGD